MFYLSSMFLWRFTPLPLSLCILLRRCVIWFFVLLFRCKSNRLYAQFSAHGYAPVVCCRARARMFSVLLSQAVSSSQGKAPESQGAQPRD